MFLDMFVLFLLLLLGLPAFAKVACYDGIPEVAAAGDPGSVHHLRQRARLHGAMMDDEPDDKSSNHSVRGLTGLLVGKLDFFLCVGSQTADISVCVCVSHQHPFAQLPIHQDAL